LLDLEDGRLLNITTVTSASRVFGLLDLDNWRRRFKGDFSDVLQRGLAFDRASLRGEVSDGMMPAAVFQLAGPSLNAAAQGSLDLARQQLDQQLVVSMPVSSAVPLAAAVVGGPLVGGAVAAAEAALKKQLEKATLLRYHVSGAWEDVQVERHTRKLPGLDGLLVKSPPTAQGKEAAP
ncbi:MAG: AsmA-like C-terminal region-containing protein, partial [Moraxellaceae bacterium]